MHSKHKMATYFFHPKYLKSFFATFMFLDTCHIEFLFHLLFYLFIFEMHKTTSFVIRNAPNFFFSVLAVKMIDKSDMVCYALC